MFGEALEDLESCGQSELLRELEVLSPGQRACGAPWRAGERLHINGVRLPCHLGMCNTYMSCCCDKSHSKKEGIGWRWLKHLIQIPPSPCKCRVGMVASGRSQGIPTPS